MFYNLKEFDVICNNTGAVVATLIDTCVTNAAKQFQPKYQCTRKTLSRHTAILFRGQFTDHPYVLYWVKKAVSSGGSLT